MQDIEALIPYHSFAARRSNLPIVASVDVDDGVHGIQGESMVIMTIGPTVVFLLSEESTYQHYVVSDAAATKFTDAAKKLIKNGEKFYTALRPYWGTPIVFWKGGK